MKFKTFIERGGLKSLALKKLPANSYIVLLYLLDEVVSGCVETVTSIKELSHQLTMNEKDILAAFDELIKNSLIEITETANKSICIKLQIDSACDLESEAESITIKFPVTPPHTNSNVKSITTGVVDSYHDYTDLNLVREKFELMDAKIRTLASTELEKRKKTGTPLTQDEELLLHILIQHHQPRKQLYWALKAASLYTNLVHFLAEARASAELG